MSQPNPILATVERGGVVECVHRGRIAFTAPGGEVTEAIGDVERVAFPRSATKVFQAIGMLECGLDLEGRLLALAAASHSGEDFHIAGVGEILSGAGLDASALQNTPSLPLDEATAHAWLASGRGEERVAQNCSGKHAAMVRTCVRAGWDVASYRDVQHPLQRAITDLVVEMTGVEPSIATDGCGAPAHTMSTRALAAAFGSVAGASEGPAHLVADAYRAYPEYVSGSTRWERALHAAVYGLVCKIGAEGTLGIGLADGRGIAIKIDDGAARALPVIAVAALRRIGVDSPGLDDIARVPVLGHGQPVGQISALLG